MLNLIQIWLTRYNFEIFILIHLTAFIITFYIFPSFETFLVVSSWATIAILFYWLFIFKVPVLLITFFYFFILKVQHLDSTNIKVNFFIIFIFFVCFICVFFWLWTNPPQVFTRCKNFSIKIKKSEENISTCLRDCAPFFGSNKEQLLWSFLVINSLCIINNKIILDLFISENPVTKRFTYIFTVFVLIIFFFNTLLEMWIVFYSNNRTQQFLFILATRIINLIFVVVTAGYVFDRFSISGDFHPPINFALCRLYHGYIFGCVVRTKEDLQAVNQYLSLGLKDPLPFIEINGVKELNRADLDIKIRTKIDLIEVRNKRIKDAVDAAVNQFLANLDSAETSKTCSQKNSSD